MPSDRILHELSLAKVLPTETPAVQETSDAPNAILQFWYWLRDKAEENKVNNPKPELPNVRAPYIPYSLKSQMRTGGDVGVPRLDVPTPPDLALLNAAGGNRVGFSMGALALLGLAGAGVYMAVKR